MHLCSIANKLLVITIKRKNSFVTKTINRKRPVKYEIKEHIFTSSCYQVQRLFEKANLIEALHFVLFY